jgi:8-oxo-dGTP pyrophosphatase MutT (NUDIX family)
MTGLFWRFMKAWERIRSSLVHACGIFDLNRVRFRVPKKGREHDFYVVEAPDWINIIPLTDSGDVVMVRQYRCGTDEFTLEIPGGMCDPGEDPMTAARREMREESGYDSDEIVPLGWVHPNPAIQNNRCHTFLAKGARKVSEPDPDANEEFELAVVPLAEIPGKIANGEITHALVITAFHLYGVAK